MLLLIGMVLNWGIAFTIFAIVWYRTKRDFAELRALNAQCRAYKHLD